MTERVRSEWQGKADSKYKNSMSSPNGTSATERFTAQRRAAGLTDDPMWFVYVLELKPDSEGVSKFYVGHTCRLQRRVHDHMAGKTVGWVRGWGSQP